jgi:hypothetical protein
LIIEAIILFLNEIHSSYHEKYGWYYFFFAHVNSYQPVSYFPGIPLWYFPFVTIQPFFIQASQSGELSIHQYSLYLPEYLAQLSQILQLDKETKKIGKRKIVFEEECIIIFNYMN